MGKFDLASDIIINDALKPHIDTNFRVVPSSSSSAVPIKGALGVDPASGERIYPKILATGSGNAVQDPFVFQKLLALTGKECPNVVYVGTPFFDREDKYESGTRSFRDAGCRIERLMVARERTAPSPEEMRRIVVEWADMVVVSGGNSLFAMLRWKSTGLDLLIKEAAMGGAVLCGGSAGCGCYFDSMQTDSLKPEACELGERVLANLSAEERLNWSFVRVTCLGFIDAFCVPHIDTVGTNGVARVDIARKMLLEAHGNRMSSEHDDHAAALALVGLGVDEKAAIVYEDGRMSVWSAGPRATGVGEATCHVLFLTGPDEVTCIPIVPNTGEALTLDELVERAMRSAVAVQSPLDLIVGAEVTDTFHRRGCSTAIDLDLITDVADPGELLLEGQSYRPGELPEMLLSSTVATSSSRSRPSSAKEIIVPVGTVAHSHIHVRSRSMDSFLETLMFQPRGKVLRESSSTHVRSNTHYINIKCHGN